MSNFIELTDKKTGDLFSVNVDVISGISPAKDGGSYLTLCGTLVKVNIFRFSVSPSYYHVRESYNLVKHLIQRRHKFVPDSAFRLELKEEYMSTVCDKICRFRDKAIDQDDLDTICEHCPLVNFYEEHYEQT